MSLEPVLAPDLPGAHTDDDNTSSPAPPIKGVQSPRPLDSSDPVIVRYAVAPVTSTESDAQHAQFTDPNPPVIALATT